jgi:hypothetical protein
MGEWEKGEPFWGRGGWRGWVERRVSLSGTPAVSFFLKEADGVTFLEAGVCHGLDAHLWNNTKTFSGCRRR